MATILLIEPDLVLAKIYCRALTSAGHNLQAAAGAQSAITAADRQKPDIVILELQLVEHSGIEFLYEFRSYPEWQAIPVIVNSQIPPAEFNTANHLLQNELGINSYLYKPQTTLKQLIGAVRRHTLVAI